MKFHDAFLSILMSYFFSECPSSLFLFGRNEKEEGFHFRFPTTQEKFHYNYNSYSATGDVEKLSTHFDGKVQRKGVMLHKRGWKLHTKESKEERKRKRKRNDCLSIFSRERERKVCFHFCQ